MPNILDLKLWAPNPNPQPLTPHVVIRDPDPNLHTPDPITHTWTLNANPAQRTPG